MTAHDYRQAQRVMRAHRMLFLTQLHTALFLKQLRTGGWLDLVQRFGPLTTADLQRARQHANRYGHAMAKTAEITGQL